MAGNAIKSVKIEAPLTNLHCEQEEKEEEEKRGIMTEHSEWDLSALNNSSGFESRDRQASICMLVLYLIILPAVRT